MSRLVVLTAGGVLDVVPNDPTGEVLAPPTHVIVAEHREGSGPRVNGQGRSAEALTGDAERLVSHYGWHSAVVLPVHVTRDSPRTDHAAVVAARNTARDAVRAHYAPIAELDTDGMFTPDPTRWILVQRNANDRHAFISATDLTVLQRTAAMDALAGWTPLVIVDLDAGTQRDVVIGLPPVQITDGSSRPNPLRPR